MMIDRPLVFRTDVPSIIIKKERIAQFRDFFFARRIPFAAHHFQGNFELFRFPELSQQSLEELMDLAHPRDYH